MKKILIINGNPKLNSFSHAISDIYEQGIKKKENSNKFFEIKKIEVNNLNLEKYVFFEQNKIPKLTTQLKQAQEKIKWAEHIVIIYPTWWGTPPALFKLFFEIIFHSGFAFKYHSSKTIIPKWDKLLKGKTAHIITTMDSPYIYYKYIVGDPGLKMLKGTLGFCGIRITKKTYISSLIKKNEKQKKKILEKIYHLAKNLKA